jgi:hypothetical protein
MFVVSIWSALVGAACLRLCLSRPVGRLVLQVVRYEPPSDVEGVVLKGYEDSRLMSACSRRRLPEGRLQGGGGPRARRAGRVPLRSRHPVAARTRSALNSRPVPPSLHKHNCRLVRYRSLANSTDLPGPSRVRAHFPFENFFLSLTSSTDAIRTRQKGRLCQ